MKIIKEAGLAEEMRGRAETKSSEITLTEEGVTMMGDPEDNGGTPLLIPLVQHATNSPRPAYGGSSAY